MVKRLIYWLVAVLVALALMVFAVSNRGEVAVTFWPFAEEIETRLYVVALIPLLLGFLAGEVVAWIYGGRWRRAARSRARRIGMLERELATLRSGPPRSAVTGLPIAAPRD